MSFTLYKIDRSAAKFVRHQEIDSVLWKKNGKVASAAHRIIKEDGQWELGERELLAELGKAVGEYAIIDDLVPNGPEILMGRIVRIQGWLRDGLTR